MPRKRERPPPEGTTADPPSESLGEARTTEIEVFVSAVSGATTHPVLTLQSGVNAGQIFSIDQLEVVIGRVAEAAVRIDSVGVSRRHARILRTGPAAFAIEDLGSTNGVFVNGVRVDRAELVPGDQVQVGPDVILRLTMVDAAQESLARRLFDASTRDGLTGAWSRKYFMGRLDAEVAYAERHSVSIGLLLFDLDHFKKVNDTHGHVAGDAVLRSVGMVVARLLRTEDVFARYGGEEFALLVRGVTPESARRLAERVRKAVASARVPWESGNLRVTLSAGLALLGEEGTAGAQDLIALADRRLYRAKDEGRDRVVTG